MLRKLVFYFCFLLSCGRVRPSTFGTLATNWPTVPKPDDRGDEYGAVGEMRLRSRNRSTRKKPAPVPRCLPQIQHDMVWVRNGPPLWETTG
jgi:hypothetical protein